MQSKPRAANKAIAMQGSCRMLHINMQHWPHNQNHDKNKPKQSLRSELQISSTTSTSPPHSRLRLQWTVGNDKTWIRGVGWWKGKETVTLVWCYTQFRSNKQYFTKFRWALCGALFFRGKKKQIWTELRKISQTFKHEKIKNSIPWVLEPQTSR